MTKKQKIIITDCDGVLTNWEFAFHTQMQYHGHITTTGYKEYYDITKQYQISEGMKYIKEFNASAAIGFLPPHRDAQYYVAQYYVKLLNEKHGYRFVVLTSFGTEPHAVELRKRNLVKLFGDIFDDIICIETTETKEEKLADLYKKYGNAKWIEDHPVNVDLGIAAGFDGLLMEHKHNLDYAGNATVVKNWEEIYNIIVEDEK